MPFSRPSLSDLVTRIRAGIRSRLTTEQMRRSDSEVYAREMAGASHELHGHLDSIAKNIIYDTAEADYLERWASIWSIFRKPAAAAVGFVSFVGDNGAVIPAGSVLIRDDGEEYETDADGTIASGSAIVAITASVAGAAANDVAGTVLTLTTPIIGVTSSATVTAAKLTNGSDIEDDASLLARLLTRLSKPPHGGADYDYVAWALEVPGVTRAWVYPNALGLGTVTVRFVRDDDATPIPDGAEVAAVQAHIDALRPVTAAVTVVAPIADPISFTFTTINPNSTAVKAAVEAELRDLLIREAVPGGTIYLSHIREAISIAAGENNYVMTSPSSDVVSAAGHMSTMGTVTWP